MNIHFKHLKLHNFMSYQDEDINIDRHGFILVSGVNNNEIDSASSNGTGKSSLFSAISWALTGLTVSGSKEVANIYLSGTTTVELDFVLDNHTYKIIRTKNPSNLKLYVDEEDKSGKGIRDTEKIVSEYLPNLTYNLLSSVIILGQGLPQKFTNNTPSGRKEVLEKLSNSDFMITDLKLRVSNRHTYLNEQLRSNELSVTDAIARQEVLYNQLDVVQDTLNQYTDEYYHDLCQKHAESARKLTDLTLNVTRLTEDIDNCSTQITNINSTLATKALEYESNKTALELQDTHAIEQQINDLQVEIGTLSKEISKLDAVTDVCPTCGQKLPNVTKIDTTEKKTQLAQLTEQLHIAQLQLKQVITENDKTLNDYQKQYNESIKTFNDEIKQLTSSIATLKTQKKTGEQQVQQLQQDIQKCDFDIQNFKNKKQELIDSIQRYNTDIEDLQTKILYYNNNIESYKSHLEINSKMNTILTRDFRGYLISNVIDYIAKQSKQYALEIFGTDRLSFELEGNNINITYDGKEYEVLSGGEKQKVDVIIQFAIRDMLCAYLNFSSNILVLDEITDSLDIVGSQNMFNLISKKLNDVESIYIISHHQTDFDIPYDDQINIVKGNDKISRIVA